MTVEAPPATRDLILDAANRLLGRHGFKKTTLDDLAREAGVGRRTIYLHFESKEEVALASIDRVVERLCVRLEALASDSGPTATRLRAMLAERVLFRIDAVRDHYHALDELFAVLRPAYMRRRERYLATEAAIFERVLREGKASGELALIDPKRAARTLLLATNSLLPYSLSPRELGARAAVARDVDELAAQLLDGLVARGGRRRMSAARARIASKK